MMPLDATYGLNDPELLLNLCSLDSRRARLDRERLENLAASLELGSSGTKLSQELVL